MTDAITGLMDPPADEPRAEEVEQYPTQLAALRAERDRWVAVVCRAIELAVGKPARLRHDWADALKLAARSETPGRVLHPTREMWFRLWESGEQFIRVAMASAVEAEGLAGGPLMGADRLPDALRQMRNFREEIAERWETEEDIHYMALGSLIEITEAQWADLVRRFPPPQAWYDETTDLFAAEEEVET